MAIPERHVFVCCGDDCRKRHSKQIYEAFKRALKERGLKKQVQVRSVDCFGQCKFGPIVIVYPDATWYAGLDEKTVEQVVDEHIRAGQPLTAKLFHRAHRPPDGEGA